MNRKDKIDYEIGEPIRWKPTRRYWCGELNKYIYYKEMEDDFELISKPRRKYKGATNE